MVYWILSECREKFCSFALDVFCFGQVYKIIRENFHSLLKIHKNCETFSCVTSIIYSTQLEQGAMDSTRGNQLSSNLLLDPYSHHVHKSKNIKSVKS